LHLNSSYIYNKHIPIFDIYTTVTTWVTWVKYINVTKKDQKMYLIYN